MNFWCWKEVWVDLIEKTVGASAMFLGGNNSLLLEVRGSENKSTLKKTNSSAENASDSVAICNSWDVITGEVQSTKTLEDWDTLTKSCSNIVPLWNTLTAWCEMFWFSCPPIIVHTWFREKAQWSLWSSYKNVTWCHFCSSDNKKVISMVIL